MNAAMKTEHIQLILQKNGINLSMSEVQTLRKAAMTLHSWYEMECNYWIDRETEPGKLILVSGNGWKRKIADREKGAMTRVEKICRDNSLFHYYQTDPRGWPLYIDNKPIPDNNYTQAVGIPI